MNACLDMEVLFPELLQGYVQLLRYVLVCAMCHFLSNVGEFTDSSPSSTFSHGGNNTLQLDARHARS